MKSVALCLLIAYTCILGAHAQTTVATTAAATTAAATTTDATTMGTVTMITDEPTAATDNTTDFNTTTSMTTGPMLTTNGTNSTEMMTTLTTATAAKMTTTSWPSANWLVTDSNNDTCMIMTFKGILHVAGSDDITIPGSAEPAGSVCNGFYSDFILSFSINEVKLYFVTLRFYLDDTEWYMWNTSIIYINDQEPVPQMESKLQRRFVSPTGSYYSCISETVTVGMTFNLTLENMELQPYSQETEKNNLGSANSCIVPSSPNAALIVGLTLGAVIFVLLIGLCLMYRKQSAAGRYNQFS
ncbi:uncharacterized protein [Diadema setosum]|uniref:uncharacterized protein n=1 Tax=Diadema setosum TaxID=31175 RepID=UPI003B3ABA8D